MTVKDLFYKVIDLPPAERGAFLDQRCAGDAELRAAVDELLAASDRAGAFMGAPTVGNATAASARSGSLPAERQIGPYKLLDVIGEGGFGVVYLAEQEHPVKRRVALKIIKLGMDTKQFVARFEAERQALAIMDHPNIARVFDAGATPLGRPYFVMELVRGEPITRYCDNLRLTPRQRLELFIPVCHAVHHAHQKGVIHRDIKPSNILVTMHDGVPAPKVIDFGIAKATQQPLTDRTLFTEVRQMIGTPEYMAPEQAEMSGLDVDTRADVYSLGVVLYELLTGVTPFDPRELRSKALDQMQRIIREVDPPKPSTRVSTAHEELTTLAKQRNVEERELKSIVRGELDWIVMKCLEKDRTRRYESAAALAADVGRYLNDDVVEAHPPSAAYQAMKFARRHRTMIGVGATVLTVLVAGLIVSLTLFARARRAERLAQQRLEDVSREAAKSKAVNDFLNGMLTAADPYRAETAGDVTVRQMLERAAKEVDGGLLSEQPEIRTVVRTTIGRAFQSLGRATESADQLRRALDERRKVVGESTDDPDVATLLNLLGMALADQNQLDEAERVTRQSLDMRQRLGGEHRGQVAENTYNLATIQLDRGHYPEAVELFERTLALGRDVKVDPTDVASRLSGLAVALLRVGKPDEAEKRYREALAVEEKAEGPDYPGRAILLSNLAKLLLDNGRVDDAEAAQREALRVVEKSLPPNHPDVALVLNGLSTILLDRGRFDEAADASRRCVQIIKATRGDAHPQVVLALTNLAQIIQRAGRIDEAKRTYDEALQAARAVAGDDSRLAGEVYLHLGTMQSSLGDNASAEPNLRKAYLALRGGASGAGLDARLAANAASQYAAVLQALRRDDEAAPLFEEAIATVRRGVPGADFYRSTLFNYWSTVIDRGDLDRGEQIARELHKLSTENTGPDSRDTVLAETRLAYVFAKRGRSLDEAETMMRHALKLWDEVKLPRGWAYEAQRGLLGEVLLKRDKLDEAAPLIREAYDAIANESTASPRARRDARERLAMLLERQGRPDEAERVRAASRPASAPAR